MFEGIETEESLLVRTESSTAGTPGPGKEVVLMRFLCLPDTKD